MKKLLSKKTLSLLLAVVLLIAVVPQVSFANENDIAGHWSESFMTRMVDQGILVGTDGGMLEPDITLPTSHYITMINKVFGYLDKNQISYSDVSSSEWFYGQFQLAAKAGFFTGYSDGTARPDQAMTRWEAALALWKAMGIPAGDTGVLAKFSDVSSIPTEARGAVAALVSKKIFTGYPDGTFRPSNTLTRAEGACIVSLFATEVYSESVSGKNITGTVIINKPGVTLTDTKIQGDLYIAEGVGKGEFVLDNVTVSGTVYVRGGGVASGHFVNARLNNMNVNKASAVRLVFEGNSYVKEIRANSDVRLLNQTTSSGNGQSGINKVVVGNSTDQAGGNQVAITLEGNFSDVQINNSAVVSLAKGTTVTSFEYDKTVKIDLKLDANVVIETLDVGSGLTINGKEVEQGNYSIKTDEKSGNIVVTDTATGKVALEVAPVVIEKPSESVPTSAPTATPTPAPTSGPTSTPSPASTPKPTSTPTPTHTYTAADLEAEKDAQIAGAISAYSTTITYDSVNNVMQVTGNDKRITAAAIAAVMLGSDVVSIEYAGTSYPTDINALAPLAQNLADDFVRNGITDAPFTVTYSKNGVTVPVSYTVKIQ